MARVLTACLLALLLTAYVFVHRNVWADRAEIRRESMPGYVLPPEVSRVTGANKEF